MDLVKVFDLFKKLDPDTVSLFMTFVNQAMKSSDINEFVKRALRKAIELPSVKVERL